MTTPVCTQWSTLNMSLSSLSPGLPRSQGPSPRGRREHILGLPPVCLCDRHEGKGACLSAPSCVGLLYSLLSNLSEASICSSAEGRRAKEGSLCSGHAGHETRPAIWTEGAGLGCWTSEQQTAELLLLWGAWGVSGSAGNLETEITLSSNQIQSSYNTSPRRGGFPCMVFIIMK